MKRGRPKILNLIPGCGEPPYGSFYYNIPYHIFIISPYFKPINKVQSYLSKRNIRDN